MSVHGQPRIFIVEDNFMYSYLLESTLKERDNFKVTSFSSATECIELLDNNPNVIILDYNLSDDLNGMEAFKIIRSKKVKYPLLYFHRKLMCKLLLIF